MQNKTQDSVTISNGDIIIYPYEELGHINHGWLDARHHFSFGNYYDEKRLGFGSLFVINDDKISASSGFNTHQHKNMEIITYVREGAITHQDNIGNIGRIESGDVQVMSAGTGIFHSEYNLEKEDTKLYQIWIKPSQLNIIPHWETKNFPKKILDNELAVFVSGQTQHKNKDILHIYQDAAIYGGRIKSGSKIIQTIKYQAYILASLGSFTINGMNMKQGDGAEVFGTKTLNISSDSDAEILVIDVPNS